MTIIFFIVGINSGFTKIMVIDTSFTLVKVSITHSVNSLNINIIMISLYKYIYSNPIICITLFYFFFTLIVFKFDLSFNFSSYTNSNTNSNTYSNTNPFSITPWKICPRSSFKTAKNNYSLTSLIC